MKACKARALAHLVAAGMLGCAALTAQAQPAATSKTEVRVMPGAAVATTTVKATATVVGIDATTRDVTLKRQDGKVVTINASPEVRNFDQIKVGDKVNVEYVAALSLELKKSGSGIRESSDKEGLARTPLGAKPGGVVGRQVTVLADVVAIDAKNQFITLRGPKGNLVDLAIQDPAQLKNIKKGDQVEAIYTEAAAVSVEAATKK